MTLLQLIRADIEHTRRCFSRARQAPVSLLAVVLYRIGHRLWFAGFGDVAHVTKAIAMVLTGAEIDIRASFGPGLVLQHPSGVVVGAGVVAGSNTWLFSSVVLGHRRTKTSDGFPRLGDNVTVHPQATVIGAISIGDGAVIGPHALVMHDVPAGAVVYGPRASPTTMPEAGEAERG